MHSNALFDLGLMTLRGPPDQTLYPFIDFFFPTTTCSLLSCLGALHFPQPT